VYTQNADFSAQTCGVVIVVNQQKFTGMCEGEKWRLLEIPFEVSGGEENKRREGKVEQVEVEVIWWAKVSAGQVASVDEFYLIMSQ